MKILRNILAVIAGLVLGSVINMGIISLNGVIIPFPDGVDVTDMESLSASMYLFRPIDFLFPFLGHAIGTLAGAFIAAKIAVSRKMAFSMVIGLFFLAGGVYMISILPSPTWFNVVDIIGAYIPMAWVGWKLAGGNKI